jgi:hypothetical protein
MHLVALVLGALIAVVGALYFVAPSRILEYGRVFDSPRGLYVLTAMRLIGGVVLILAGPSCREPEAVRVVGILIALAGIGTPFVGLERQRRLLSWWSERGPGFNRVWAAVTIALGLLLIYAIGFDRGAA